MPAPDMSDRGPILVVDDDAALRELVDYPSHRGGRPVVEADSGEAALLAFDERPPALVILDVCATELTDTRSAAGCDRTSAKDRP